MTKLQPLRTINNRQWKNALFSDRGNDLKAFVIEIRSVNHGVIPSVETIPVQMKRVTKDLNRVEKKRIHFTRGILNPRSSEAQASELLIKCHGAN